MGCGCGGNKGQRGVGRRPIVTPKRASVRGGLAGQKTANQLRALELEKSRSGDSLSRQRREIESKRRNAILRRKFS